jgi:hypothetical protein
VYGIYRKIPLDRTDWEEEGEFETADENKEKRKAKEKRKVKEN